MSRPLDWCGRRVNAILELIEVTPDTQEHLPLVRKRLADEIRSAYYAGYDKRILDDFDLDWLPLSTRASNALRAAGITTAAQIWAATDEELLRLPSFGVVSLREVRRWVVPIEK